MKVFDIFYFKIYFGKQYCEIQNIASHNITHITHYTGEVTLHYFQALTTFIQILSKIHSFTLDTLQYFIDSATKWNLLISIPKTELTRNALSRAPNIMQFGFGCIP